MLEPVAHTVFISYAAPDRGRVTPYFELLSQRGLSVWMDHVAIKGGQNWDFEIQRAFSKASIVVAFISSHSTNRRGYVQRELKAAIDKLTEKLIDDIYLIPVLLDDGMEIPAELRSIQCLSGTDERCTEKIYDAVVHQYGRLGVASQSLQQKEDLFWTSSVIREAWEGLPGYEVELETLNFDSKRYADVKQIGDYVNGKLLEFLFEYRQNKLRQLPDLFSFAQDAFRRTHTLDAHYGEITVKGKILTLQCAIHWYSAGAAHPNFQIFTHSFVLEPLTLIKSCGDIFADPETAFPIVQRMVRSALQAELSSDSNDVTSRLQKDMIDEGTETWKDLLAFIFEQESITFLFSPYQVAGYALGIQVVRVPYEDVASLLRNDFRSALEVEHLWH